MKHKFFIKSLCLICTLMLITATGGCSLNSYSVDELKVLYPKAFENSLSEELYYWKETVNTTEQNSWKTCNVFAETDKNYAVLRDKDGNISNMKIDVFEEYNKKSTYKSLCGKSVSSSGEEKSFLFENEYDNNGNAVHFRKSEMTPQSYIKSEAFKNKYSLHTMLGELKHLSVDDMIFDIDNSLLEHKGKVVKFSFSVKDEYIKTYKEKFGQASIFENSKYATIEFAYDRFASIIIYAEEKLGGSITADKEIYKLEVVYFGPVVNIPAYDSDTWKDA